MRTILPPGPQPGVKNRVNRPYIAADGPSFPLGSGRVWHEDAPGYLPRAVDGRTWASLALLRYAIHVGLGGVPRDDQPKELGSRVEPSLLSSRQPLHKPGDPLRVVFPAGEPNHEIVQPFGAFERLV